MDPLYSAQTDPQQMASMLDVKCFVTASRRARGGRNLLAGHRQEEEYMDVAIPTPVHVAVYNARQQMLEDSMAASHGTAVAPKFGRGRHMTAMYELEEKGHSFNPHYFTKPVLPTYWTPKL